MSGMNTEIVKVDVANIDETVIEKAADIIKNGGLVAPVWLEAARLPLSLEPDLTAAMRQPLLMSERACLSRRSGWEIFSI